MPIGKEIRTIFVTKQSLVESLSEHHGNIKIRHHHHHHHHLHSCSHCSKSFSSPSHLARHTLIHTREKPCLCSECGQQFSQISSLERHQRTKHLKSQINSSDLCAFQCSLCHEYFSLKHNLKMHERKLHRIRTEFFCSICSAYFTCNASLQKHINFRHRSLIPTMKIDQTYVRNANNNESIKIEQSNERAMVLSDSWSLLQHDQRATVGNSFVDPPALSVSSCCKDERSSFFSSEMPLVPSSDLFGSSHTQNDPTILFDWPMTTANKSIYHQQQVHYQILKCNETN